MNQLQPSDEPNLKYFLYISIKMFITCIVFHNEIYVYVSHSRRHHAQYKYWSIQARSERVINKVFAWLSTTADYTDLPARTAIVRSLDIKELAPNIRRMCDENIDHTIEWHTENMLQYVDAGHRIRRIVGDTVYWYD